MQRRVAILAECYLNECLAMKVIKIMEEGIQVKHKSTYGRDRVIKGLMEFRKYYDMIIGLIDYEKGISREYVNRPFSEVSEIKQGIVIAKNTSQNIYAIVFDPRVEDVLGIKEEATIKKLKSSEACKVLDKYVSREASERRRFEEIVGVLSNIISELIRKSFPTP